jgi:hypothetical protein
LEMPYVGLGEAWTKVNTCYIQRLVREIRTLRQGSFPG